MATLTKYNLDGKKLGTVSIDDAFADSQANSQMTKDYIVALRANARQWSASTKTRKEVKHSTRKPRPQKGSGRARQGMTSAPQYRGGGIVFGPKPKFDQHVKMNQKERKAVIRALLADHIRSETLIVLEETKMDAPKTKAVASFLKGIGCDGRVLVLAEEKRQEVEVGDTKASLSVKNTDHVNFSKSLRNIPKTSFKAALTANGYDLMLAKQVIVTEKGVEQLLEWLA